MDAKSKSNTDAVWIEIEGSIEIGSIGEDAAKAIGLPAGPIRLAEGLPGPKGYGLAHIKPERVEDLKKIGFETARAAIVEVTSNWEVAVQANEPNRVVLVRKHRGRYLNVVAQVFEGPHGRYWSVVTIVVGRRVREDTILFQKIIATEKDTTVG